MDTIVVLIETDNKHGNLVYSLNQLNIPFIRIHEGKKWTGMFDKMRIYTEALEAIDNEWVILSDARDVLFYKSLDVINDTYQKYYSKFDIVFQAEDTEVGCVDWRKVKKPRYAFGTGFYKYPCAGLAMGRRSAIIDFFKEVTEKAPHPWTVSDQPSIEWAMKHLNHKVVLDTECRLFQQMGMGNYSGVNFHLHFNAKFIKNTYTNTEPCIFHGAGNTFLHPVWRIINKRY